MPYWFFIICAVLNAGMAISAAMGKFVPDTSDYIWNTICLALAFIAIAFGTMGDDDDEDENV